MNTYACRQCGKPDSGPVCEQCTPPGEREPVGPRCPCCNGTGIVWLDGEHAPRLCHACDGRGVQVTQLADLLAAILGELRTLNARGR